MAIKNTNTLRIRLPDDVKNKLEAEGETKGLAPATMARTVLCEHYKTLVKK